jgi:hypothetical protein
MHDPDLDLAGEGVARRAKLVVRMADGRVVETLHSRSMVGATTSDPRRGSMGAVDAPALLEKYRMLTAGHKQLAGQLAAELHAMLPAAATAAA